MNGMSWTTQRRSGWMRFKPNLQLCNRVVNLAPVADELTLILDEGFNRAASRQHDIEIDISEETERKLKALGYTL